MAQLPYLNLGCGMHYNTRWTNVDFIKTGEGVIAHNLLKGVPFGDGRFDVVYHSHVLEHFLKDDAAKFISECYRVLKPGGVIRIAVPDLEQIVKNYERLLAAGKANPANKALRADYEWIVTEMYDQAVRAKSGGEMVKALAADALPNEDFIMGRIGNEGKLIREEELAQKNNNQPGGLKTFLKKLTPARSLKELLLFTFFSKEAPAYRLGKFRLSGEIHQWMYDVYSLGNLLKDSGFVQPQQFTFNTSQVADWASFGLDEIDGVVRKPDSLFIEARKI